MAKKKKKNQISNGIMSIDDFKNNYQSEWLSGGNITDKKQKKESKKNTGYLQKSSGNIFETILGTGTDIGLNVLRGIGSSVEGVSDLLLYGASGVARALGNEEKADKIKNKASRSFMEEVFDEKTKGINTWADKNSVIGDKGDEISQGIGNVATMLVGGVVGAGTKAVKGASTLLTSGMTMASSMGSGMSEAYKEGATDKDALKYGTIAGIADTATEWMFGGLGKSSNALGISKGLSSLDDKLAKKVSSKFKNQITKNLAEFGIKSSAEGIEEVSAGILQGLGKKLTYMSDKDLSDIMKDEQLLDQFIAGAVTSGIVQTPGLVKSTKQGRDFTTNYTQNEQSVIDNVIENRYKEELKNNPKMSKIEQNKLHNRIETEVKEDASNGFFTTEEMERTLGGEEYNKYKKASDRKKEIEQRIEELQSKPMSQMSIGEYNSSNEEIKTLQEELKNIDTDTLKSNLSRSMTEKTKNDSILQLSYQENAKKGEKFSYQLDDKASDMKKSVYESASKLDINNTKRTHDFVETVSKLAEDTNTNYTLTNTKQLEELGYKAKKGKIINGVKTKDGKVLINIDSNNALNRIVGHETSHLFENTEDFTKLQDLVFEYAKTKGEYDTKLQEITDTYKDTDTDVNNELTADLIGDYLFTDKDFVSNLSTKQPNIFQKIYDKVKHLYNMATAGSKEKRQLEKVKYTFEQMYKNNQVENKNAKEEFSIGGIKAINNLPNSKFKNDALNDYNKALKMADENIDNETIRQETKWFKDKKGDWKFEFTDENLQLKDNVKLQENSSYKLGDIIEHNYLFTLYPELKNVDVKFKNMKTNGSHYAKENLIELNNKLLNKNNKQMLGTVLHEVQHAIQNKENFTHGTTNKLSRKRYFENLGEIEADNTKQRFLKNMTKEDRKQTAPETAKENPKHSQYNNYMNNRNVIDKAKDTLYNHIKEVTNNASKSEEISSQNQSENNVMVDERGRINKISEESKGQELDNSSFSLDNKGRKLSKQQQEYFKDSKVRDNNGKLLTVYHGTRNDFTIFDLTKAGQSNGLESTVGFWFTESQDGAKQFSNEVWYGDNEEAKAMEVYLNIKNPKIYEKADYTIQKQEITNQREELFSKRKAISKRNNIFYDWNGQISETDKFRMALLTYDSYGKKELTEAVKEYINPKNATQYTNDVIEYSKIESEIKEIDKKLNDLQYTDSYELFRNDIYKVAGMTPTDANMGGTGMVINNSEEIVKQYIDNLKTQGYDGIIIKETNYDNNRFGDNNNQYVAFYPNQIKNIDNLKPTPNEDIRFSLGNRNTNKTIYDVFGEQIKRQQAPLLDHINNLTKQNTQLSKDLQSISNDMKSIKEVLPTVQNNLQQNNVQNVQSVNKTLNPTEISNLSMKEASTTPRVDNINVSTGEGQSSFWNNINEKVNMLKEDSKAQILSEEEVKYYQEVTNEESLNQAFRKLAENGAVETRAWFNKKSESATDIDVAEGWILMKQYEDAGDYDGMVQVAKKMREIGTKAGQTVQAFNILNRMTPEGMVKYAQSELTEAYEQMVKNKTQKWIDKHKMDFELKPEETQFIIDTMNEIKFMEDSYEKKVKLGEINKIMTDKLPPERGQGMKAWMRISMLFNPKTQVRNVIGNALISPVNMVGDVFASGADRIISKATGVRTTGTTSIKNYLKGMKQGLYQSYNDFKKGINTRNIQGNRFEIGEGNSFNDNSVIGHKLNQVDHLLSFMLDAGDRTFYEASFTNSINNQLVLNNTDVVTSEMVDIATNEALSRTWQDNNNYTKFVLNIRKGLNNIKVKGYGLGDVLIPFAKTPANLTKALIDYSPAGLINVLVSGNKLKNSLNNGQYTAQLQHKFVQDLGKATAGTMLYVLGYALAKSGALSGESDEDKDVANFMKNTLGTNSYSIKIGGMSFTYDWAQPVAGAFSIMANIVGKDNQKQDLTNKILSTLDTAGNLILEQSFMESINTVLNNNDGIASGIKESILELPSRAVPTFMKQITDMIDGTQRTTFEYDKPIDTMINKVKAKIPGLSETLAPTVDTLGREVKKYGGKNNLFNVFVNPANVTNENISESAQEIYRLYKATGDKTIMPRVAPYYVNQKGEKITLSAKQKVEFQEKSGKMIEDNLKELMNSYEYQNMSDTEKASIVNKLVGYSYNIAQHEVVGTDISKSNMRINNYVSQGGNLTDYYIYKYETDGMSKQEKEDYLAYSTLDSYNKELLYENITLTNFDDENRYTDYKMAKQLGIDIDSWLSYDSQDFESDVDSSGKTVRNSRLNKVFNFVNGLSLSVPQKAMLIKMQYSSFKQYDNQIIDYLNSSNMSFIDKARAVKKMGFDNFNNSIINYVSSNYNTIEEQAKILEDLGFKVYSYGGKTYVR